MKQEHFYDQIFKAFREHKAENAEQIKALVAGVVDAHEDAWFDLLMNGTNGASDETLEILHLERTYETRALVGP